jgi:hypothetical protein
MSKIFTVTRRSVSITKTVPIVIGVAGVARAGKDSLGNGIARKLSKQGIPAVRLSFATEVKIALDKLIKTTFGFSAMTEKPQEKELIRPIIVAYAEAARKNDPSFWIKKLKKRIETNIENGVVSVITDVRFKEEVFYIKKLGGFVVHLKRIGNKAINLVERVNDPIVQEMSDYKIKWKSFNSDFDACAWNVNKLFLENNWSTYGAFKKARNGSSTCDERQESDV